MVASFIPSSISGYYPIEIKEEHKERTAFTVGHLWFFLYNRLPFGLTNSPATYQGLMEEILADYNLKILVCCIFIDDPIIFGKTYVEHLRNLELVFNRIRESNMKLAPDKSEFFQRKVKYVPLFFLRGYWDIPWEDKCYNTLPQTEDTRRHPLVPWISRLLLSFNSPVQQDFQTIDWAYAYTNQEETER